jgi:hypothetical protein
MNGFSNRKFYPAKHLMSIPVHPFFTTHPKKGVVEEFCQGRRFDKK